MHKKLPHLMHPKYRADIDGLRAVAVLSVIGFHAFPKQVVSGFIGVDIFFVISGFLISSIIFSSLERDRFSFIEFYSRRIRRIFPALSLVLITTLLLGGVALYSDEYKQFGKHVAGGAGFVANFVLWGESGYFDGAAKAKPLLHLWSLAIEDQFYVFWPLLLVLAWKYRWGFLKITALIAVLSLATNIYLTGHNLTAAFYSPLPRLWELMLGGILAYVTTHKPQLNDRFNNLKSVVGFSLLLLAYALIDPSCAFPGWWVLLPTLGTALIISAGETAWLNGKLLANKVVVWFGLISYPLYLWHWPLLSFGMIVEAVNEPSPAIRNPAIILSILLGWLTYRFIERPVRQAKNGRAWALGLLILMTVIGGTGYFIYKADGFSFRAASTITKTYDYDFKFPPDFRHSCHYPSTLDEGSWDWCNDGNVEKNPAVVLLGDSFAGSFSQTLLSATKYFPFTFKQLGRGQCPPLLDYGPPICAKAYQYYLEWVKSNPAIKVVVLTAQWPSYVDEKKYDFAQPPLITNGADFEKSLIKTLSFLTVTDKRIIVVLAPPGGVNPTACLPRPLKVVSSCALPLNIALEKDQGSKTVMKRLLRQFPQVKIYDPYDYLCDDKTCLLTENKKIFYIDAGHMSVQGGQFLAAKSHQVLKTLFFE